MLYIEVFLRYKSCICSYGGVVGGIVMFSVML